MFNIFFYRKKEDKDGGKIVRNTHPCWLKRAHAIVILDLKASLYLTTHLGTSDIYLLVCLSGEICWLAFNAMIQCHILVCSTITSSLSNTLLFYANFHIYSKKWVFILHKDFFTLTSFLIENRSSGGNLFTAWYWDNKGIGTSSIFAVASLYLVDSFFFFENSSSIEATKQTDGLLVAPVRATIIL
ncbi:hypothetical protein ACJX0J_015210 [Zea mays]